MIDKSLPIYKCEVEESLNDDTGIFAVSFVNYPAVEVDFVALSKQKAEHKLHYHEDKQILTGVVLIPDKMIYRYDENMGEYYITYSAKMIEKISHKMMRNSIVLHNTTHQHEDTLGGNYLTEMWIVEDPNNDKSNALGFKDLPKGTLMCSYKITNSDYWKNEVKTGNVKGFSLEGYFYQNKLSKTPAKKDLSIPKNLNNNKKKNTNKMSKNTSFLNKIRRVLQTIDEVETLDTTDSGENVRIFTLADGSEIIVAEDGFATIDGEQAPSGEHILSDDNVIVIDAEGYLVETTDEPTSEEPAVADTELKKSKKSVKQEGEDAPAEKFTVDVDGTEYEVDEAVAKYVADLLTEIASLKETVEEDAVELKKLRKSTPSARPANVKQAQSTKSYAEMSRAEKLAFQLSQIQKK